MLGSCIPLKQVEGLSLRMSIYDRSWRFGLQSATAVVELVMKFPLDLKFCMGIESEVIARIFLEEDRTFVIDLHYIIIQQYVQPISNA